MFVITGGGSGIGKSLAYALARKGESVCIVGRREALLAEVAESHSTIEYVCADISLQTGREQVLAHLEKCKYIKGLVHNAGVIEPISPLKNMTELAWRNIMATNLDAPLFLTQTLSEKLTGARVLHVGSGAAYFPVYGWGAYCVSKAGLSMLTRCCQLEMKEMAFASLMPGIADTFMQDQIRHAENMDEEKRDFFKRLKQNNQLLSPETIAAFMCWLLLEIDTNTYVSKEWDIYDTTHHPFWLVEPHVVPIWE